MPRREFSKSVYAQIVHRATNDAGHIVCEGCGLVLGRKPWHVDHTKPDGLEIDKSRKLTAGEGKLLGVECCHKPKTKNDVAVISKAKAVEAKHLGITRSKQTMQSRGFAKPEKSASRVTKQPLPPRPLYTQEQT